MTQQRQGKKGSLNDKINTIIICFFQIILNGIKNGSQERSRNIYVYSSLLDRQHNLTDERNCVASRSLMEYLKC
jgi:hypothetical protein